MYQKNKVICLVFFLQIAFLSFHGITCASLNMDSSLVKYGSYSVEYCANILQCGCDIEDKIPQLIKTVGNPCYDLASIFVVNKFLLCATLRPYQVFEHYFFNKITTWNKVPVFNQKNVDKISEKLKSKRQVCWDKIVAKVVDDEELGKKVAILYDFITSFFNADENSTTNDENSPANKEMTEEKKIDALSLLLSNVCDKDWIPFSSSTMFYFLFSYSGYVCWKLLLDKPIQAYAGPSFKNIYNKCMFFIDILNNRVVFIPVYLYRHRVEFKKFLADVKIISPLEMA